MSAGEAINRTRFGDIVLQTLGVAVSEGEVVELQDNRVGIAQSEYAANEQGSYAIAGKHEIQKDTSIDFSAGEDVYWDASENEATNQANADESGDFFLGFAEEATASGAATVNVLLRGGICGDFVVDGSDAATTQTLANALKAILIENGLMKPV